MPGSRTKHIASNASQAIVYDTEVIDYRDRIIADGGTISVKTLNAVNKLVISYKQAGIWNRIQEKGLFCGNSLNASLIKLKYPAGVQSKLTNVNFVEGDYSETGGLKANSSAFKHLQTGFIPLSHIPGGNITDCHLSVYGMNTSVMQGNTTVKTLLGGTNASNNRFFMRHNTAANRWEYNIGIAGSAAGLYENSFLLQGQLMGSNIAVNNGTIYYNGINQGVDTAFASAALTDMSIYLFAHNDSSGIVQYSYWNAGGYSIGQGLTSAQALADYQIMYTFQQAIGRINA
jgi:hypothetical protein